MENIYVRLFFILVMTEVNISNKSYYQIKFNEIEFLNNFKPNSNEVLLYLV